MNGLVSIIMPSYNTAEYITDSINSVIAQTYKNWELIIVDDCSTDETDSIVSSFLSDPRIRYYKNNKNSGAALTRNRAISLSRGEWIAFLDSDDLWLPNKLEEQLDFMVKNNYYFSYTKYKIFDEKKVNSQLVISGPKIVTRRKMFQYCWPGCLTVIYNSKIVKGLEIADIKKNNDYAMWLKVSKHLKCYFLNETLAVYRKGRTGSISTSSIFKLIKWHYLLFRISEKENVVFAFIHTLQNLFFGLIKKIFFEKKLPL